MHCLDGDLVVLPDVDSAASTAAEVSNSDCCRRRKETLFHASGRPWLVGHWSAETLRSSALNGSVRMVSVGAVPIDTTMLTEAGRNAIRSPRTALGWAKGDCFVFCSAVGQVTGRGDLSGRDQLFRTEIGGVAIAATSAELLARLHGWRLDEAGVGLHLAGGLLPSAVNATTVWYRVTRVPGHHGLHIDERGRGREFRRWWQPPEQLGLAGGANSLRGVLQSEVSVILAGNAVASSDLSGGLDSGYLCFEAARSDARLVTVHWASADPANDDGDWTRLLAAELGEHSAVSLVRGQAPGNFDVANQGSTWLEEPSRFVRSGAQFEHQIQALGDHGSTVHFSGYGGDELFLMPPCALSVLVRRNPAHAIRQARVQRSLRRWTLRQALDNLTMRGSYRDYLSTIFAAGSAGGHVERTPWAGPAAYLPAWLAEDLRAWLRQSVRDRLTDADTDALARDPASHLAVQMIQSVGRDIRALSRLYRLAGIELATPFLAEAVIDATLSVRLHERYSAGRYKQLLAEAARGCVPDVLLERRTKGEFSADVSAGFERNRRRILALFDDSLLVEAGYVDGVEVRRMLGDPRLPPAQLRDIDHLIAVESWLRTASAQSGQ
ncbi:MAG TPA: asparagine synthase-related protein [Jatrophihabitantaceae bacterium]|jgi:asparagine synthase (glutamine-hydrolysing)|nr:asparagine synthase-related protein [Jatrophihabitantaceae bacterium]